MCSLGFLNLIRDTTHMTGVRLKSHVTGDCVRARSFTKALLIESMHLDSRFGSHVTGDVVFVR